MEPLVTARLVLRPFAAGDLDDLVAMDGDDRVMRYLGSGLTGRTREQCARALDAMHARTLDLARVVGLTWPENVPSQRVLEKAGFLFDREATHYERTMRVYVAPRSARA